MQDYIRAVSSNDHFELFKKISIAQLTEHLHQVDVGRHVIFLLQLRLRHQPHQLPLNDVHQDVPVPLVPFREFEVVVFGEQFADG